MAHEMALQGFDVIGHDIVDRGWPGTIIIPFYAWDGQHALPIHLFYEVTHRLEKRCELASLWLSVLSPHRLWSMNSSKPAMRSACCVCKSN